VYNLFDKYRHFCDPLQTYDVAPMSGLLLMRRLVECGERCVVSLSSGVFVPILTFLRTNAKKEHKK